jgi:hypothetical protein
MVGAMYVPAGNYANGAYQQSEVAYTIYGTSQIISDSSDDEAETVYGNINIMFNDGYVVTLNPKYYIQTLCNYDIADGDLSLQTKSGIMQQYFGDVSPNPAPDDDCYGTLEYPDEGYDTIPLDGWGFQVSYSDSDQYFTTQQLNSMIASKGKQ